MSLLSADNSNSSSSFSVRIHSAIADGGNFKDRRGSAAIALWYFARALDSKGSGWAVFSIEEACDLLGRGKSTVKRYLTNGQRLGLFRSFSTTDGIAKVYYSSLHEVARRCELESFGAVAELEIDQLKNLKFWAIQLEAQALQNQSRFQARNSGGMKRKVAKPENVLPSPSSNSQPPQGGSPGVRTRLHITDRFCFMHHSFNVFGGSQKTIARRTGRSESTIQRRLDNKYRTGTTKKGKARSVPAVLKRQIAIELPDENPTNFEFRKWTFFDPEGARKFVFNGRVFKSASNIYEEVFHIQSMKASKAIYCEKRDRILSGN